MKAKRLFIALLGLLPLAAAQPAAAELAVAASTDLSLRAGPGPVYPVIAVIDAADSAVLKGCIEETKWCSVDHGGTEGWAYSDYLIMQAGGAEVAVSERGATLDVPAVRYEGFVGANAQTVVGVLKAPRDATGDLSRLAVDPPASVIEHMVANPSVPVRLQGEAVIGATVPEEVQLHAIPGYEHKYVYVNDMPVLVDGEHRIVHIFRR